MKTVTELDIIEEWSLHVRPVHCSNCANCKVTQDKLGTTVYCAAGYGDFKPLSAVIKPNNPRGWRDASKCPDFQSMT